MSTSISVKPGTHEWSTQMLARSAHTDHLQISPTGLSKTTQVGTHPICDCILDDYDRYGQEASFALTYATSLTPFPTRTIGISRAFSFQVP